MAKKKAETLEDFFREIGEYDEMHALGLKQSVALQFEKALKDQSVNKVALARRMKTSRTQVDRVLDPRNVATSIETLQRAATALGRTLSIRLVESKA